jgi:hypothetical protein
LGNVVMPVVVSFAAYGFYARWRGRLPWGLVFVLAVVTFVGIYLLGPLYVVVGSKLAWNAVGPSAITFREWVDLTFAFPISTLSLSTYDGTCLRHSSRQPASPSQAWCFGQEANKSEL